MSEFWAMGGYGAYVWAAYGVTALFMALLFVWSWLGARARETELEQVRKLSRAERRAPASATMHEAKAAPPGPAAPAAGVSE
ncbi:MAG: heme exporter protein CcmD [Geminicoccaceae bacterium]